MGLSFLKRVARAQVKLEELCDTLPLEEEEDGNKKFSESSRGEIGRRSLTPEGFTEKRIGSRRLEAKGDDGTRVDTAFGPMLDDDSRHMKYTNDTNKYESAINAINRYGDSEDEEGDDEELVSDQNVVDRNYQNAIYAAGTEIRTIAHERQGMF